MRYPRRGYIAPTAEQTEAARKRFSDALKADQRFNIRDRVRWVAGRGMPFAVITSVRFEEPDSNVKGLIRGYRYSWMGHCDVPQSELVAAPEESK